MFFKKGYSSGSVTKVLTNSETTELLASPHIAARLEKHARTAKSLAPKSDDFLYFSIIFLKAAEASLIDDHGNNKSVGAEKAWGYWDDDFKWHGNVNPHRNNNGDIFPESELKKAARAWIGMPLCVDHKSDSVDGIRGIILDTHYDEKLKQVVGLCALDRVNYPDLARKVETGVVRFGSMGTAVETSICTECQNKAKTARDYCEHIMMRNAWGEINVGLKPIEYSLVVQPAEPGAKLLRCFASIKNHKTELESYGLKNVDSFVKELDIVQADSLDRLLTKVCGPSGCDIVQRRKIITAFVNHNGGIVKSAALSDEQSVEVEFAEALAELKSSSGKTPDEAPELYEPIFRAFGREFPSQEVFTSPSATAGDLEAPATIQSPKDSEDTPDYTGSGGDSSLMAGVTPPSDSFGETGGVGPESYSFASLEDELKTISNLKEEIMSERKLRKRAEMRRRVAYHLGGADGVEPSTFKDESGNTSKMRDSDKHMHPNPASLGGTDGMAPGDKEVKEKQKRAQRLKDRVKKHAYHYGGADGVEPSGTYKSEDYHKHWNADKHMTPVPASMGGTDGMFPGDKEVKEKQKRASYNGPALRTRLTQKRNLDGSINKSASKFEVFAGDKLVIATTAGTIYGKSLGKYWDFLVSPAYGKKVVASIRSEGLEKVATLLTKKAQEGVVDPMAAAPEAPAELPGEMPEAPMMEEPMGMEEELPAEEDVASEEPKEVIEEAFSAVEDAIAEAQEALSRLGEGGGVEVNIGDVGIEEDDAEKVSLSNSVAENLKNALAEADVSADELAILSASYDNYSRLTSKQKKDLRKMTRLALKDSAEIVGETKALTSMASIVADSLSKVAAEYTEPVRTEKKKSVKVAATTSEEDSLIAEALELRKRRREALIAKAMEEEKEEMDSKAEDDSCEEEESMKSPAHDGIGQHPTKSKVQTNTAEEVANKQPTGGSAAGGSSGGPDVQGDNAYSGTKSRQLAEQSSPQINHADDKEEEDMKAKADDGPADIEEDVEEVAEEAAEKEVEEHEEDMHGKASDSVVVAKAKSAFMAKKVAEEREEYRVKLRRAYDIATEMQEKNLLPLTKAALNRQIDKVMEFDDKAFEAFKQTIASVKAVDNVKVASDLGGVNVGTSDEGMTVENSGSLVDQLSNLKWSV